jgi:hypothetical protein
MGGGLAWVLLPVYSWASSRRRGRRRRAARSARNGTNGRDGLVAVWPRLAGGTTRMVMILSWGGFGQGLPLLRPLWGCNSLLTIWVSGVDNTELDNGQPVRSRRREHGCRKRWRGGVMVWYGRDTDDDEVQRPKELTVMGRKTRKAQCTSLYARDSNKEKLSKSFDRSWGYFLAHFQGFEGYEHGLRTNTRWMTSPHWLSENLDCSTKFLLLSLPLG